MDSKSLSISSANQSENRHETHRVQHNPIQNICETDPNRTKSDGNPSSLMSISKSRCVYWNDSFVADAAGCAEHYHELSTDVDPNPQPFTHFVLCAWTSRTMVTRTFLYQV